MHFELAPNLAMFGRTGSHAYGTATPTSDVDYRGVVLTPLWLKVSTTQRFEQHQGDDPKLRASRVLSIPVEWESYAGGNIPVEWQPMFPEPFEDCTVYDLQKACTLMAAANPNMLELLWLPEDCLVHVGYAWAELMKIRHAFLSTRVQHTFSGYAHAQWRKIRSHRSWLLDPPKAPPTRADFGLPEMSPLPADDRNRIEESIEAVLRSWGIEDLVMDGAERDVLRERMREFWSTAIERPYGLSDVVDDQAGLIVTILANTTQPKESRIAEALEATDELRRLMAQSFNLDADLRTVAGESLGLTTSVLELLARERSYRAALKQWQSFVRWKAERNPARAELEARFGYDTKHAMHLIRLLRMGVEALEGRGIVVRRPDAGQLLGIREGLYSYEELSAMAEMEMAELELAARSTSLPKRPDVELIDRTIARLYNVDP
jgi:uncharacterized protein